MFDFAALVNQILSQMPELTTPAQSSAPASTPASAVSTATAPANSISRALVGGWQPPPNMSGTHTAGPTWQDYENYYNRLQSTPTAYSTPVLAQQTTTPAATPTTTTAKALTPIEQVYGAGYYQNIDPNSPLGQVLAQGGWQMAHGGITDSLPYTQRRD